MKVLRTIHVLLVLGIVFVTASYARGAVRGYVPGSLNDSEAAVTANIVETVTVMMDLDQGLLTNEPLAFFTPFFPTPPTNNLFFPLNLRIFDFIATEPWVCIPEL